MKFSPSRRSGAVTVIVLVSFTAAFICLLSAVAGIGWKAPLWLCAAVMLTVGIQLTQRYLLCTYEYFLTPSDELYERNKITVICVRGERRSTVCSLTLESAVGVFPKQKNRELEAAHGKIHHIFNWCVEPFPAQVCLLLLRFNGELTLIKLQDCPGLSEALKERV